MNVNVYLRESLQGLGRNMHVAPNIPEKKLNNAIKTYGYQGAPGAVIAVYDNTLFGSAKEGLLITGEHLHYGDMKGQISCAWLDIQSVQSDLVVIDAEKQKSQKLIRIHKHDGETIEIRLLLDDIYDRLASVLSEVIGRESAYAEEEQVVPVEKMPEALKIAYGKVVVNLAYENDSRVDETELAEILLLMTRLGLTSESRLEIRAYLSDSGSIEPTEALLARIDSSAPSGQIKSIHVSLVKDLLNVHMATAGNDLANFSFLHAHRQSLDVTDDEVNLALEAIKVDQQLLNEHVTDDQMTELLKMLGTKAASVGIPIAAVYLTGSVVGLSAAGITSGLATLGLGGFLGMSSMVTGVGVAVLLGVGAYAGINKLTGASEVTRSRRRELMLTEVVKQTQKTIADFMEDINFVVRKLNELIHNDNLKGEQILRLAGLLEQLSGAGQVLTDRSESAQGGISRIHCAQKLDTQKLAQLTREPTMREYHDFILGHYRLQSVPVAEPRPGRGDSVDEYLLKDELNARDLENLAQAFDAIGYYKAGQVVAGKLASLFG